MISQLVVGAAVWLASSPTGRTVAKKGYKMLSQLGDQAVEAMPGEISGIFTGVEKVIRDLASDDQKKEG